MRNASTASKISWSIAISFLIGNSVGRPRVAAIMVFSYIGIAAEANYLYRKIRLAGSSNLPPAATNIERRLTIMVGTHNITPPANKPTPVDPLITAINSYRDGLAGYNATPDNLPEGAEEDLFAALVLGPDAVLTNWRSPATSHEAALEAISLAEREKAIFKESPVADAMEAAAIGYWKNAGGSFAEPHAPIDAPAPVTLEDLSPDVCLTAPEAAAYLRISDVTLARWRSAKRGPIYSKAGGKVLYRVSALIDFVTKNERKGTRPDK
ncbi:helix-turn-helix domain-containing protein [Rhizobium leguminosarum bv. viciae]|nr:helix-turn-helix domain-containing protein [Rhizobium leguminosarum bv. viciae]